MKKITKIAALAVGAALAAQAAQAQVAPGDLVLAFSSSGVANDYISDLGSASSLFASTSVVDLSSDFNVSSYNSAFSATVNPITMAAVGGSGTGIGGQLYTSASSLPARISGNSQASATSIAEGLPVGGTGLTGSGGPQSWTTQEPSFAVDALGAGDPRTAITGSVITENVYEALGANFIVGGRNTTLDPYTLEGYLTLNLNNDTLTFTSENVAVPEPATFGLLAGAGLLALSLRRKFSRQNG